MDLDVINIISNVGFPIVCVLAMGWYVKYKTDKQDALISEMNTCHRSEVEDLSNKYSSQIDAIREALNNNTRALCTLTDYIKLKG